MTKRIFDLVLLCLSLPLVAPVIGVIALAIRVTSRGPVFLALTCYGAEGRVFRQYRFRCVHMDSLALDAGTQTHVTAVKLTWVVRYLLLCRLNRLPQVWNILRGEMAVVGPPAIAVGRSIGSSALMRRLQSVPPGAFAPETLHPTRERLGEGEKYALSLIYANAPNLGTDFRVINAVLKRSLVVFGIFSRS